MLSGHVESAMQPLVCNDVAAFNIVCHRKVSGTQLVISNLYNLFPNGIRESSIKCHLLTTIFGRQHLARDFSMLSAIYKYDSTIDLLLVSSSN